MSSVLSVTGTPAPVEARERVVGDRGDDAGLPVRGRAEVERDAAARSARRRASGSSIAPGPWAIRSGSTASARRTCAAPPHSPAWTVMRRPAGPGGLERRARGASGSGIAPPRGRRGPSRSARRRGTAAAVSASSTFALRVVRAQRRADQPDLDAGPRRRVPRAARRPPRCRRPRERPPRDVEQRPPADLDVADVLGGLRLDELGGDPLERLGVLHQRDRQVERREQLGLVACTASARRARRASRRVVAAHRRRACGRARARYRSGASRRGGGGARPWASPRRARAGSARSGGHGRWYGRGRRAGDRRRADAEDDVASCMSTILVTGASGFVGSHDRPGAARRRPPRRRPRPRRGRPARRVLGPPAGRPSATASRPRIGDVTKPATLAAAFAGADAVLHLVAIPRDYRRRRGACASSTPRGRAPSSKRWPAAGVRRLVHMGAMGVDDDPNLHYASSKAKAEALVAASRARLDDPQAVAPVRAGRRVLQHRRGPRPAVARRHPGPGQRRQPVPADPRRRCRAGGRRGVRRPDHDRRRVRARRAALLDVPRDHARGRSRRWASAASSSRCPCRSSGSSPATAEAAAAPVPGRDRPAPPTAPRQHRAARRHRATLRVRAAADGGGPRLPPGEVP